MASKFMDVVDAFATGIGGSPITGRERERLRSNWIVTEASRQLYGKVVRPDADRAEDAYIWIEADRELELIAELGERLAERKGLTPESLEKALDDTLVMFRSVRPSLVAWGLCFERPSHTDSVTSRLLDAFLRLQVG
jgi:hypothetical protein